MKAGCIYCSRACYLVHHGAGPKRRDFWSRMRVAAPNDCWPWLGQTFRGRYGAVWHRGRPRLAHRVAWELANRQGVPVGLVIRHTCDNPMCCNPAHLLCGTHRENTADMLARNRHRPPRGARNGQAKLTEAQAIEIRKLALRYRGRYRELAARFGVSVMTVSDIHTRRSWRHAG